VNISFLDLKTQYKNLKPEIDNAVKRVINSQIFVLGPELNAFEKEFAEYLGIKYVAGVNSGTDALILALLALGVGKGDEVITSANSFVATTAAIIQVGAKPVLIDCNKDTYQIDTDQIIEKITKRTKAILPVHLYGAPAEIGKLAKIAKDYKLFLVEDAAQAHGAAFKNKKLGTFGNLAIFSFYPSKNLGAYGDGGAIVTDDKQLYEKIILLRNHGQVKKYVHKSLGINSRLDEIQAAILRVKLKHLDLWNKKRNRIAENYENFLKSYKAQKIIKGGKSNYYVFVIETKSREKLQKYLLESGIQTLIHYPIPIHLQKAYENLGYKKGDFPVTEELAKKILSIPIYPELLKAQQSYIINKLNNETFFKKNSVYK